jgi:hypothetical protein
MRPDGHLFGRSAASTACRTLAAFRIDQVQTGSYLDEDDIVRLEGMRPPAVGWAVGPLPDLAERGGKQGFVRL